MSIQVTATGTSARIRRGAPEWLLNINRFGTRSVSPTAATANGTTSKEVDVENSAGTASEALREVANDETDLANLPYKNPGVNSRVGSTVELKEMGTTSAGKVSQVSGSGSAVVIPDNLVAEDGLNDSELYRRRPTSAMTGSTNSTQVQGDGNNEGAAEGVAMKNVHFPEGRE